MILRAKYNEAMDKIEITDELRSRVLNNVQAQLAKPKVTPIKAWRRYASIAAVFVLLLVGGIIYKNTQQHEPIELSQGHSPATEVENTDELSDKVGFAVKTPHELPFTADKVSYTYLTGDLAEVVYTGKENSLCYRMSRGSEDNSGVYSASQKLKLGSVTLSGDDGSFYLAVWQEGGFSYSLLSDAPLSQAQFLKIISSIK